MVNEDDPDWQWQRKDLEKYLVKCLRMKIITVSKHGEISLLAKLDEGSAESS